MLSTPWVGGIAHSGFFLIFHKVKNRNSMAILIHECVCHSKSPFKTFSLTTKNGRSIAKCHIHRWSIHTEKKWNKRAKQKQNNIRCGTNWYPILKVDKPHRHTFWLACKMHRIFFHNNSNKHKQIWILNALQISFVFEMTEMPKYWKTLVISTVQKVWNHWLILYMDFEWIFFFLNWSFL